jgi:hypothetical protein
MWTSKKLKLRHQFLFSSPVWRLLIPDPSILAVEERDAGKKEVFYHFLDLQTGDPFIGKLTAPDGFWSGIECIVKNKVIFHGYRSAGLPFHRGIYPFDLKKNEFLWKNEDYSFLFATDENVFVYKQKYETREFFVLDIETGEIAQELGDDSNYINNLIGEKRAKENYDDFIYPENFLLSEFNNDVIILNFIPELAVKEVTEIFEKNGMIFLIVHIGSRQTGFYNELLVINREKEKLVQRFRLNSGTENIIAESCFIFKDTLFLIFDKKKIELWEIK